MSSTFCALPFKHLCVGPEGTARTCCVSHDFVTDQGAPMSLSTASFDDIWNSAYMRNIRRAMLAGERVSACDVCYASEAASGQSYRTHTGNEPVAGRLESPDTIRSLKLGADLSLPERPTFLKLEVSNLCNLKCRMCFGGASSQIERDPVHSRWSGGTEPLHAVWRGDTARIGPEPRIGVMSSGLQPPEYVANEMRVRTDGHAIFNVPVGAETQPQTLTVGLHVGSPQDQPYRIVVNGHLLASGRARDGGEVLTLDLGRCEKRRQLVIEILSDPVFDGAGSLVRGISITSLVLHRRESAVRESGGYQRPVALASKFRDVGPWYMDDSLVFEDVLRSAATLERLYFTGGEPLLHHRVHEILRFLVTKGAAARIHLELSTNCTSIQPEVLKYLGSFKRAELLLSLDAIGAAYDYIRYPARWTTVQANVRKLSQDHGLVCKAVPVVQAYNILNLVELLRYCDENRLETTLNILHMPDRLAIHHLPPSVRRAAAAKLRDYLGSDCPDHTRRQIVALVDFLEGIQAPLNEAIMREFMLFTNDLDASRGQSFEDTHAEFVMLAARDGYRWTRETRFHPSETPTPTATERDYAWI